MCSTFQLLIYMLALSLVILENCKTCRHPALDIELPSLDLRIIYLMKVSLEMPSEIQAGLPKLCLLLVVNCIKFKKLRNFINLSLEFLELLLRGDSRTFRQRRDERVGTCQQLCSANRQNV
jgi:hypothetical protein